MMRRKTAQQNSPTRQISCHAPLVAVAMGRVLFKSYFTKSPTTRRKNIPAGLIVLFFIIQKLFLAKESLIILIVEMLATINFA
jgi:hypothetical protein